MFKDSEIVLEYFYNRPLRRGGDQLCTRGSEVGCLMINPLKTKKTFSYYILEQSSFDFKYVRQNDIDIPKDS